MPDPDPPPPQPRAVSPARWLLMLLPSVLMLAIPAFESVSRRWHIQDRNALLWMLIFFNITSAVMLCFGFGFLLEKWQRGKIESSFRAIGYGCSIFFTNCVISYAGCAVGTSF